MMLVRKIAVRNIRSYNDGSETRLDFPEGVTLLEGDIGSGKSTLLYALEFALFGFSDMKGAHLLSEGRKKGSVSVSFESDGQEITIDRSLKVKGEEVVQDECFITSGGQRTRLSPSDLKERVVSILGFNEPTHPRAESLVYRYAVFTPQEQMKEILMQNAEERLHVIRRVLGAQSYQVAAENSDLVEKGLKEIAYVFRKTSEDLDEKKVEAEEKSRNIAQLESEIPRLDQEEADCSKLTRRLESEWKDSLSLREGLARSEGKMPTLRKQIAELNAELGADEERLGRSETQLSKDIEPIIKAFEARTKPDSKASDLESELAQERDNLTRLKDSKQAVEAELAKTRDLLSKGVCPLCGQRISGDFPARSEHSERELARIEADIAASSRTVAAYASRLEIARQYEDAQKAYSRAAEDKARVGGDIEDLRRKLRDTSARLASHASELEEASSRGKEMVAVSARITELEARLAHAREQEKQAGLALSQARQELTHSKRELLRLSEEVAEKQKASDQARRLTSYQNWLSSFFGPAVQLIEEQTLTQAATRFNEHFQRYFTSLVDDPDMVVRVREDFTPLFEREGFEQDFEALSGGERTSMALAYRFALNSVVRESVSSRPELVILDEPTDGFSREQVYKMRSLLDELDSKQVILVSHERELESMADHIFRIEKKNGTSEVSRLAK
ncbi:MAG TPA: SMC family ATPase [Nitrososphaerales archaeon]|nr:SMC family ATPase [Nitrososphaerales archaeon]